MRTKPRDNGESDDVKVVQVAGDDSESGDSREPQLWESLDALVKGGGWRMRATQKEFRVFN